MSVRTLRLLASVAMLLPCVAHAQSSDVILMRKLMPLRGGASTPAPGTPTPGGPSTNPNGPGSWRTGDWTWASAEYCTTAAPQTRAVECVAGGAVVADARCAPVAKPETKRTEPRTGGCFNVWKASEWSDPVPACGETTQTRTITCTRSDGTALPDEKCETRKGETVQPSVDFSLCSNGWVAGPWQDWSSQCSAKAVRERVVSCQRSDGAPVEDRECNSADRPLNAETASIFDGCGYHWDTTPWAATGPVAMCGSSEETRIVRCVSDNGTGAEDEQCGGQKPVSTRTVESSEDCTFAWKTSAWSEASPACGATEQTRTAYCLRSDGKVSDAKDCKVEAPETVRQVGDYRACTYDWEIGAWSEWNSTCSSQTPRNRIVKCVRSDGAPGGAASCSGDEPATSEIGAIYSGCSYEWQAGKWSMPESCGQVTQTRAVSCLRSDGATVDASSCDPSERPADNQLSTDYRACSYHYETGSWGEWDSTCRTGASRTRKVTCVRDDGTPAENASLCSTAGTQPDSTEISNIYTSCSYEWVSKGWSKPAAACGKTLITETFACLRSDGTIVGDTECTTPNPTKTAEVDDYRACQYSWNAGQWGQWDSSCSAQATRTRQVTCSTSSGVVTKDTSNCAGEEPETSEQAAIYSGCSYTWEPGAWTSPRYCGAVTESRTITCKRSDGVSVTDGFCTDPRPIAEQPGTNYSACTYAWITGAWSNYSSTCSSASKRTRSVQCERSDKTIVGDTNCTGTRPASSEEMGIFTGCQYKWTTYPWQSTYSCSESDVQTRRVECTRVDDLSSTVSDSFCASQGTKPATSQTVANTETCSPTLVNGGFESDLYGWNSTQPISVSTTISHGGGKSLKMDQSGQLRQYIKTVVGKTYTLSYWAYTKSGLYMNSYGSQGKVIENRAVPNSTYQWVYYTGTFPGNGGIVQIGFFHYAPNGGTSWLDDVTVTSN